MKICGLNWDKVIPHKGKLWFPYIKSHDSALSNEYSIEILDHNDDLDVQGKVKVPNCWGKSYNTQWGI